MMLRGMARTDEGLKFWRLDGRYVRHDRRGLFLTADTFNEAEINLIVVALYRLSSHLNDLATTHEVTREKYEVLELLDAMHGEGVPVRQYIASTLRWTSPDPIMPSIFGEGEQMLQACKDQVDPRTAQFFDLAYRWHGHAVAGVRIPTGLAIPEELTLDRFASLAHPKRHRLLSYMEARHEATMGEVELTMALWERSPRAFVTNYNQSLEAQLEGWGVDLPADFSKSALAATTLASLGLTPLAASALLELVLRLGAGAVETLLEEAYRLDATRRLIPFALMRLEHPTAPAEWCLDLA